MARPFPPPLRACAFWKQFSEVLNASTWIGFLIAVAFMATFRFAFWGYLGGTLPWYFLPPVVVYFAGSAIGFMIASLVGVFHAFSAGYLDEIAALVNPDRPDQIHVFTRTYQVRAKRWNPIYGIVIGARILWNIGRLVMKRNPDFRPATWSRPDKARKPPAP
jgi:hypothetical protein